MIGDSLCALLRPFPYLKAWSRASKTPVYAKALLCLVSCFTV